MTLAPLRPQNAPSEPDGAEPTVTAVIVTRHDPRGLADLLEAVLRQSHPPDAVLVLDRTGGATLPTAAAAGADEADGAPPAPADDTAPADGSAPTDGSAPADDSGVTAVVAAAVADATAGSAHVPVEVREVAPSTPVRAAVHAALLQHDVDGAPTTLAWVLPVGTTPTAGALGVLVDTWRRSPSTGLVGPKHLDVDDPHLLRALAIHSTRGGRLLPRPGPGEPDQGQYDRQGDALAVPFAGSLVERDLLVALRGWETSFGDVGADLDLGWRAHGVGRRVVMASAARMRTEQGVAVATASDDARRRAARRVALARAPWWIAPLLALWIAVTSVAAAAGLLLLKRPSSAWAELSSLASLDPIRGTTARWRTQHRREVGRRDLRALFEPRRTILTGWGDAVHHALVTPRPPSGDAAHDLNPRSWLVKVARHPGVLAVAGALAVTVLAGRTLGQGVVTGLGSGLTGGELVGNRAGASTLWSAWTDGWTGAGLGGPDPVGPHAPLLAIPAWLVDHVPLVPSPASPAGLAVGLVVLLGMPLAATSAFLAFRTMVVSRPVRGLAAFAWATTGVAAASVAEGRLGAVVALVLLPFLASGLWLVATRRSTATSAFATALSGVVLGAFAPVLLAVVVVLALVTALVRSGSRVHSLVIAVVPVAVLAPWLVRGAEASWPVLAAGVGLAQWGGSTTEPWQLALLHPSGAGAPLVWAGLPLVVVAVLALARGRAWGTAGTSLALLAPVLLAGALVAPSVRLGTVPAGVEGAGEPITLWSGTLLLPLALVLVLSLARGVDGIRFQRAPGTGRLPLAVRYASLTTTGVAVLLMAAGVAWSGLGAALAPWADPRPAVSVEQAEGAFATRALFVSPGDRGAGYVFVGREAAAVVRPLPVADADDDVASRVSTVLGDASAGPELFADTATDLLAVRSGIVPEVTRRLDATEGLQRVAPRDGWEMWRVSPTGTDVESLVAPPRLRVETPTGTLLVQATGQHAATRTTVDVPQGGRLVVAEPTAWAEHASVEVDGVVLEPVGGTSTPAYALPFGESDLRITVTDPLRWWHLGQVIAFACLAFLAVPFGRRDSRVGQR